jgi:amino acid transporter
VIVSVAAQAYDGPQTLIDNADDVLSVLGEQVFGSPLDKILIIAVLTSAAASPQTTILPTARTSLSMARRGAMPASLGAVHPRYLTPHVSTILMGVLSIVWYVGLTIVSENILFDSIAALGLMIAFYYGITGFACTIYYRRLRRPRRRADGAGRSDRARQGARRAAGGRVRLPRLAARR